MTYKKSYNIKTRNRNVKKGGQGELDKKDSQGLEEVIEKNIENIKNVIDSIKSNLKNIKDLFNLINDSGSPILWNLVNMSKVLIKNFLFETLKELLILLKRFTDKQGVLDINDINKEDTKEVIRNIKLYLEYLDKSIDPELSSILNNWILNAINRFQPVMNKLIVVFTEELFELSKVGMLSSYKLVKSLLNEIFPFNIIISSSDIIYNIIHTSNTSLKSGSKILKIIIENLEMIMDILNEIIKEIKNKKLGEKVLTNMDLSKGLLNVKDLTNKIKEIKNKNLGEKVLTNMDMEKKEIIQKGGRRTTKKKLSKKILSRTHKSIKSFLSSNY